MKESSIEFECRGNNKTVLGLDTQMEKSSSETKNQKARVSAKPREKTLVVFIVLSGRDPPSQPEEELGVEATEGKGRILLTGKPHRTR